MRHFFSLCRNWGYIPSIESPQDYMMTNVQGTVNVLEAARFNNVKNLFMHAPSCYGINNKRTKENSKIDPQYPYA